MKQTAILDRVQGSMRPGVITRGGFLGTDTRKLIDILSEDDAAVRRLGVTHEQIAERMSELRRAGAKGLGLAVGVPPRYEVRVDSVRGKLPCPFRHEGVFAKTCTTVRNLDSGESVAYSDMNIHMIGVHGFYEGRGAPFRLAPGRLVELLDIRPLPE